MSEATTYDIDLHDKNLFGQIETFVDNLNEILGVYHISESPILPNVQSRGTGLD